MTRRCKLPSNERPVSVTVRVASNELPYNIYMVSRAKGNHSQAYTMVDGSKLEEHRVPETLERDTPPPYQTLRLVLY